MVAVVFIFFMVAGFASWQLKVYCDEQADRKASHKEHVTSQIAERAVAIATEAPLVTEGPDTDRRPIEEAVDEPESDGPASLDQPQNK